MSHFAEIDDQGRVIRVIVAEQDFIQSGMAGDPARWLQTSYNTRGGQHLLGGVPFRKNFAGVGYYYDKDLDAFIPPRPFNSWILDYETGLWQAPLAMPDDGNTYLWDEATQSWQEAADITPE